MLHNLKKNPQKADHENKFLKFLSLSLSVSLSLCLCLSLSQTLNNNFHGITHQKLHFKLQSLLTYHFYFNFILLIQTDHANFDFNWCRKEQLYGPFLWMGFNWLKVRATLRRQFTFYH